MTLGNTDPKPPTMPSTTTSLVRTASSPASNTTTIRTNNKPQENVQIIAVRNDALSANSKSRSSSPCVSKVLVNSDVTATSPRRNLSSASFSVRNTQHPHPALKAVNIHNLTSQPSSLPAMSNAVKRSRSTSDSSGSSDSAAKVQVFQLEQHCKNLEGELDNVKDEILKILTDKTSASKENESLKHYVKAYNDLRLENEDLRKEVALLKIANPPKSPALSTSSKSSSSSSSSGSHTNVDRSSPDGQEYDLEDNPASSSSNASSCQRVISLQDDVIKDQDSQPVVDAKVEALQSEVAALRLEHEKEKKTIEERCKELEESLDLMKSEFENMEDYWQVREHVHLGQVHPISQKTLRPKILFILYVPAGRS